MMWWASAKKRQKECDRARKQAQKLFEAMEVQEVFIENITKKEIKMTREEAKKKCFDTFGCKQITTEDIVVNQLLNMLEALGLLKFEELKVNNIKHDKICSYEGDDVNIRIERWPEGYVLWFNGRIGWKSWGDTSKSTSIIISALLQHTRGLNPEQTIKYLNECGYQIVRKD